MKQFIRSSTSSNMRWSDWWTPYSGSESSFQSLYVDDVEVGYIESYDIDGYYGYIAYLKADPNEYEESLGEFRTAEQARARLEKEVVRAQNLIDTFPIDSSTSVKASTEGTWYNVAWYSQFGSQNGECVLVPAEDSYDPYSYIERYLSNTYGDEYGGIADYMETDEPGYDDDIWSNGYQPIESATSDMIRRYSDVRPYEDRRYWYFTTHGIGPGTIPDDLTVLETQEGQNDKGTWGTFVCLDGVLNTDELSYYDLRELAPNNITSATDVDDEDDWDWTPYHGHNYCVNGGMYSDQLSYFDDPVEAIEQWFKNQEKHPMDVAISCPTKALALELVKAATPKLLTKLYNKYPGCPYRLDYLIHDAQEQVARNCRGFYEGQYGYGDTIHPFGVG